MKEEQKHNLLVIAKQIIDYGVFKLETEPNIVIFNTPYQDCQGEEIEIGLEYKNDKIFATDLSRVSGLLFTLDQYHLDERAYKFLSEICHEHNIEINLENGQLLKEISTNLKGLEDIFEFLTVIITIMNCVKCL